MGGIPCTVGMVGGEKWVEVEKERRVSTEKKERRLEPKIAMAKSGSRRAFALIHCRCLLMVVKQS